MKHDRRVAPLGFIGYFLVECFGHASGVVGCTGPLTAWWDKEGCVTSLKSGRSAEQMLETKRIMGVEIEAKR